MFKELLIVNEHTDPTDTMERFRVRCEDSDLANPSEVFEEVAGQVNDLSERGSQLAAVGSNFSITRTLKDDDYEIIIKASFGEKPTVVERIRSLFIK